jgi:hypothetical protein
MTVAEILAKLALEFLVYHEIGHIMGGHLEIQRTISGSCRISEFERPVNEWDEWALGHVLECDADAVACHVSYWVDWPSVDAGD